MATSKEFIEDLKEDHLCCSICQDIFVRPKALPCLHTFCQDCLRDYTVSRFANSAQFTCPLCRQITEMPQSGVAGFPMNYLIVGLLDTLGSSKDVVRESLQKSRSRDTEETSFLVYNRPAQAATNDAVHAEFNDKYVDELTTIRLFGTSERQCESVSGLSFSPLNGDLFISDPKSNKVVIYSNDGMFQSCFKVDCSLKDITVTRRGTVMATVDNAGSAIMDEYTSVGKRLARYGSFYKYEVPNGIAISDKNKVFVSCLQSNSIRVFTDRRKPSVTFGSKGSGTKHFLSPYYLCINGRGDVIVADTGNHRIKMFSNGGDFKGQFGKQGSEVGNFFYPMGVAVDKFDNIYVADANNYRVQVFDRNGNFICCPISEAHRMGLDVKPIAVDISKEAGFLAVAFKGSNSVQVQLYRIKSGLEEFHDSYPQKSRGLVDGFLMSGLGLCCIRSSDYDKL